jgi:hypothetical protein
MNTKADWDATTQVVRDRLEFVELITQLNHQFLDPAKVRYLPNGGWTHPWMYFDSLRNYLLLTCFDLLGQPAAFKDFQTWLTAKTTAKEREAIVSGIPASYDPIKTAALIHREYLEAYGAKTSFYRFIDVVIPASKRAQLLYSVRIRRIDPIRNKELEVVENDDAKKKWLYEIRNSYTHRAVNTGSPGGRVFKGPVPLLDKEGNALYGWMPIQWQDQANVRIEYGVRCWPAVLKDTVAAGLETALEELHSTKTQ